jgi:hypothetical protein
MDRDHVSFPATAIIVAEPEALEKIQSGRLGESTSLATYQKEALYVSRIQVDLC